MTDDRFCVVVARAELGGSVICEMDLLVADSEERHDVVAVARASEVQVTDLEYVELSSKL